MDFTKLQGAGNDFVLVETNDDGRDWPQVAKAMCDRHFGIGADGLLLLLPSEKADFRMRIFNTDGSEAEACGNGLRCLSRYIWEKGLLKPGTSRVVIETLAGMRRVEVSRNGAGLRIQTAMGVPRFGASEVPVVLKPGDETTTVGPMIVQPLVVGRRKLELNLVSMGNTHAVYFSHRPVAEFPLASLGPQVEQQEMFPRGVNFEVARVLSRQSVEAQVWEKGVGETLACGSGACAITVAAQLRGYVDRQVDIKLPGGVLRVEWDGVGEVLISGPAEMVFTGRWPNTK